MRVPGTRPRTAKPIEEHHGTARHRPRQEHRRMLGNGWCTRPRGTDCSFEAICEGCGYYQTTIEFAPTLRAQRDHATTHGQTTRVELYGALLDRLESSR
jgi:integrase/recombinase XerD